LASLRLGMKVIGSIKDDQTKEQIGTHIQMLVRKSKVGPPFGVVNFEMPAFDPIDKYAGLLDYMVRHEEITHPAKSKKYWFADETEEQAFEAKNFSGIYEEWRKKK